METTTINKTRTMTDFIFEGLIRNIKDCEDISLEQVAIESNYLDFSISVYRYEDCDIVFDAFGIGERDSYIGFEPTQKQRAKINELLDAQYKRLEAEENMVDVVEPCDDREEQGILTFGY